MVAHAFGETLRFVHPPVRHATPLDIVDPGCETAVEFLLRLDSCSRYGARFVSRAGRAEFHSYGDVLDRAKDVAGTLQGYGLQPGDRVALILPTSVSFFDAFLGAVLAGGIPAALYPPVRLGRLTEYFTRTRRMLETITPRFLVTDRQIGKLLGPAVGSVRGLQRVLDPEELRTGAHCQPAHPEPEAPAFLQFSSGTTAAPKAVIVTHGNLMHALDMIDGFFSAFTAEEAERGGVCWLPLYHDMGLVGCMLIGLYHPGTITFLRPEVFLARPSLWLRTISEYRALVSPAPHFAYGYCVERIRDDEMNGVDLSCWRVALNGAEPIDTTTMQRFTDRFSRWGLPPQTMTPVYGLAEAGLAVSFSDPQTEPRVTEFERVALSVDGIATPGKGRTLPSVGRAVPNLDIDIRDDHGSSLGAGRVGRIMVRGPSITAGYYNDPDATRRLVRDGWLDTGDLGFFHEANLYIAGRAKDVIIIRGRNYAPQEIEEALTGVSGIRPGCVVAVSHMLADEGEQLIILAETDPRQPRPERDLIAAIRHAVSTRLALQPHAVRLLRPGTLPRTSSGKMRRSDALQMFLAGARHPPRSRI